MFRDVLRIIQVCRVHGQELVGSLRHHSPHSPAVLKACADCKGWNDPLMGWTNKNLDSWINTLSL